MHTRNGTGWVTFSMDGTSAYFWEGTRTGQPTRLTSDSRWTDPEDIRMPGSYQKDDHGWDTDNYPGRDHVVGRGLYVITATEEEEKGRDAGRAQATLTVECYGIDCKGDVVVEYDCAENKFYVGGRETTWLDHYDNPTGLQPTPPRNFTCTNAQQTGAHPHFTWSAPEAPEGVNFRYKVWRRRGTEAWKEVASGLTVTEWTDEEMEIAPGGPDSWYRATANAGSSPESDPSNEVRVNGYLGKRVTGGPTGEAGFSGCAGLWVYPNPCNPVTTVRYVAPEETQVKVGLYDLGGREVLRLAEGRHAAGEYQAELDGRAVSSGVYLVRMVYGAQALSAKVLVVQ